MWLKNILWRLKLLFANVKEYFFPYSDEDFLNIPERDYNEFDWGDK